MIEAIFLWSLIRGCNDKPFEWTFKPKPPALTAPTTDPKVLSKLDEWHAEGKKIGSFYVRIKDRWQNAIWRRSEEQDLRFWSFKGDRYGFHYSDTAPLGSMIGDGNVVTELRHTTREIMQHEFLPSYESIDYGWLRGYFEFIRDPMPFLKARPKEEFLERYNFEILSESDKELVLICKPRRANDYRFESTEITFDKAKPWIPAKIKIKDATEELHEMTIEVAEPIDGISKEHFDTEAIIKKLCDPTLPDKSRWTLLQRAVAVE